MNRQRQLYPVKLMARVLEVSRSGFYAWMTRGPSARSENDEKMKPLIRIAHRTGRGTYGARRIQTELQSTGTFLGRDQIGRLRREMGLRCIQKRKFKATTNSAHSLPVAENLLDQQFAVNEPGTVYGADITYGALGLHKPSEMVAWGTSVIGIYLEKTRRLNRRYPPFAAERREPKRG